MSVAIMSELLRTRLGSPQLKLVALKLADCANDDGRSIYPSKGTISDQTELSCSTVKDCINALLKMGLLIREQDADGHNRKTAVYAFDLEALEKLPKIEKRRAGRPSKPQAPETPAATNPGFPDEKTPPPGEKTPPPGGPNPSKNHQEEPSVVRARARTTKDADETSKRPYPLSQGWLLPEEFRKAAEEASPQHADYIEAEARAFARYNADRVTVATSAQWLAHWESWWARACARLQLPAAQAAAKLRDVGAGTTVRDTSESFAAYTARMVREGKVKPDARTKAFLAAEVAKGTIGATEVPA